MEALIEVLVGLAVIAGLSALAQEEEQSVEESPALIPIPVKEGRQRQ